MPTSYMFGVLVYCSPVWASEANRHLELINSCVNDWQTLRLGEYIC